ncbi:MAG: O-phospho-L-seryl-tRNA:Cys-tRNA synthase [Candidatus Bathyarchaeia archaeon]
MIIEGTGIELRAREELFINLEPLQRGGVMPSVARKVALCYIDGYSTCDYCLGTLHINTKPAVREFLESLSKFLQMDFSIITNGCREAKFAVMHAIASPGDSIVMDANRHYTSLLAAERIGLKVYEVPNTGYPEFKVLPQAYAETFEMVRRETGRLPALALLTHVDWLYGNLSDAKGIGKVCEDYGIPFLLNTAYSSGRMPINGKELMADFITGSGHKSWAAGAGTVGILALSEEWIPKLLKPSKAYNVKPLEILGCSARGSSTLALMASFPHVKERVARWDEEVAKARWFSEKMEALGGIFQIGEKPHNHDLLRFETPALDRIAKVHPRKGFFLYDELFKRKIVGIKPGRTRSFEVSTYGLSRDQLSYVIDAFEEILKKYGR